MDVCFWLDICLTFFTAVQKRGGLMEFNHKKIAKEYFEKWFWIDLSCSIPVEFVDLLPVDTNNKRGNLGNIKILRLLRLPRLWRIVRLVRLLKQAKVLS